MQSALCTTLPIKTANTLKSGAFNIVCSANQTRFNNICIILFQGEASGNQLLVRIYHAAKARLSEQRLSLPMEIHQHRSSWPD